MRRSSPLLFSRAQREGTDLAATLEIEQSAGQLVEKSRAGCLSSFEQLVRMHEQAVYNYLLQITGNPHDAEDAAQETFVKAFRGLSRYDHRYRFSSWLFTIAKRTAINQHRQNRRHEGIAELENVEQPAPGNFSADGDLWALAKGLKPKLFEVLWLYYGEGFDVKETARIMSTNRIYVKVLLHRARGELKRRIKPEDF